MYINVRRRRAKQASVGAGEETSNYEQMLLPEYLNKSSPPLKSQSRISNNIHQLHGCVPSFLYLSLFLVLFFSHPCLACFACISEHVRFRDFNWPEGIPPRGLTLRGNFRDILSRAGDRGRREHAAYALFPVRWESKSARLSRHGGRGFERFGLYRADTYETFAFYENL